MATERPIQKPGMCACGCGGTTALAPENRKRDGFVKGQPYLYIQGHNGRLAHPEIRFWQNVNGQAGPDGCWPWIGKLNADGYGLFTGSRRRVRAHRFAYELLVGPIPDGLVLDHLCRNPCCVNPTHLEPVTIRENVLRGVGPSAKHAVKTHCVNGHPFDSVNTHITAQGWRKCRACEREARAQRKATRDAS